MAIHAANALLVYELSRRMTDTGGGAPGGADEDLAAWAPRWLAQGAAVLGGCCRTGPDTIARMRRALLDVGAGPVQVTPS